MDCRTKGLRTTLMLGTVFLAGVATGPVTSLAAIHGNTPTCISPRSPETEAEI
jgi:hypothetical protein